MKAYDKYEVDETFKYWSSDLAELNVIEVVPLEVLDKIRAEIDTPNRNTCDYFIVDRIEEIIDKYRGDAE